MRSIRRAPHAGLCLAAAVAAALAACSRPAATQAAATATPASSSHSPLATLDLAYDKPAVVGATAVATAGGLPSGNATELFRPFEQRSADRTGLGLGLAFSRWAVEANHGRLYARSLPGKGCVFTVDLPRCPLLAIV